MPRMDKRLKGFILWELEHYPENKRQLERFKYDMITAKDYTIDGQPRQTGAGDPTARKVEQLESSAYIRQTEQTLEAIERVLRRQPPEKRKAVELMYWRRTHTATGAGMEIGASKSTVYNWIDDIVVQTAKELGFLSF